jgi:hypothetical protein
MAEQRLAGIQNYWAAYHAVKEYWTGIPGRRTRKRDIQEHIRNNIAREDRVEQTARYRRMSEARREVLPEMNRLRRDIPSHRRQLRQEILERERATQARLTEARERMRAVESAPKVEIAEPIHQAQTHR